MKVIEIVQTCSACPAQWEIKLKNGKMIYVRYRWGYLSIRISAEATTDVYKAVNGTEVYGKELGDSFDGCLDELELIGIMKTQGFIFD